MADQRHGGIPWCDRTWNPIRGCSRVSEGCRHCYAEVVAGRFSGPGMAFEGLARATNQGARWTGDVVLVEKHLEDPLHWRKPQRIFVNSVSDLFHEKLTDDQIDRIFAIMALAPQHTFLVLTKRPERMRDYLNSGRAGAIAAETGKGPERDRRLPFIRPDDVPWPLPNVWPGISVENQATADERLPFLLESLALTRWISYEPALEAVNFGLHRGWCRHCRTLTPGTIDGHSMDESSPCFAGEASVQDLVHWIVVGGESGPEARGFDPAWARSTITQCRYAGIAPFVKQLGSFVLWNGTQGGYGDGPSNMWPAGTKIIPQSGGPFWIRLADGKGGDPDEWPEDLRVREFPAQAAVPV